MRLYAKADGTLQSAHLDPAPATLFRNPETVVATLDIDEDTNAGVVADIQQDPTRFRLSAGVLTKDGVTVTIAAASPFAGDRVFAIAQLAQLDAGQSLTLAQATRLLRFVLRWIVRHS